MAEARARRRAGGRTTPDESTSEREVAGRADRLCSVGFCPVAMLLSATEQVRPDVVEHLVAAGREFLLAAKALLDARASGFERSSPIQRIEVE